MANKHKAQSTVEYVVLFGVITALAIAFLATIKISG